MCGYGVGVAGILIPSYAVKLALCGILCGWLWSAEQVCEWWEEGEEGKRASQGRFLI